MVHHRRHHPRGDAPSPCTGSSVLHSSCNVSTGRSLTKTGRTLDNEEQARSNKQHAGSEQQHGDRLQRTRESDTRAARQAFPSRLLQWPQKEAMYWLVARAHGSSLAALLEREKKKATTFEGPRGKMLLRLMVGEFFRCSLSPTAPRGKHKLTRADNRPKGDR